MNKRILIVLYGLGERQFLAAPLIAKIKQLSLQSEVHLITESSVNREQLLLLEDIAYFHFVDEENWRQKGIEKVAYRSIYNFSPHAFARALTQEIESNEKLGFINLANGEPSWTSSWFKHIEEYQDSQGRDLFHLLDLWRLGFRMDKIAFPKTREIDEHFQTLGFCPRVDGDRTKAEGIYKIIQNLHATNVGFSFEWFVTSEADLRLISEVTCAQRLPLKIVPVEANSIKENLAGVSLFISDDDNMIRLADFYSDVPMLSLHPSLEQGKKLGTYRRGNWMLSPLKDSSGTHLWNERLVSEITAILMSRDEVDVLRWAQENSHLLILSRTNLFLDGTLWSAIPVDTHFRASHFRSLIENIVWMLALNEEKNIGSTAFMLAQEVGSHDRFLGHLMFWESEASWLESKLNSFSWLDKDDNEWGQIAQRVDSSTAWQNQARKKNEGKNLQDLRRRKEFRELNIKRIQIKGRLIQQIQSFVKEPSA